MLISIVWFKAQLCLILLLIVLSACQPPQQQVQCCQIEYGLLQPGDLKGHWELVEERVQIIQPTNSRYEEFPVAESARQYLSGNPDERNKEGVLIHDIHRYTNLAPSLGKLNFKLDAEETGTQIVPPGLPQVGLDRQIQCLSSNRSGSKNSIIACTVEVRYQHILSTLHFYFDGLTSDDKIGTLIN